MTSNLEEANDLSCELNLELYSKVIMVCSAKPYRFLNPFHERELRHKVYPQYIDGMCFRFWQQVSGLLWGPAGTGPPHPEVTDPL